MNLDSEMQKNFHFQQNLALKRKLPKEKKVKIVFGASHSSSEGNISITPKNKKKGINDDDGRRHFGLRKRSTLSEGSPSKKSSELFSPGRGLSPTLSNRNLKNNIRSSLSPQEPQRKSVKKYTQDNQNFPGKIKLKVDAHTLNTKYRFAEDFQSLERKSNNNSKDKDKEIL